MEGFSSASLMASSPLWASMASYPASSSRAFVVMAMMTSSSTRRMVFFSRALMATSSVRLRDYIYWKLEFQRPVAGGPKLIHL
ncbi:MAG: hypothetical protein BWY96_03049 [Spirochaetes bacterium ADurb.BinA120]|nr:MAG: hypothetical protein BWY96_03049 [Spirochaetes bacterium ADurb.BinA120]